MTDENMFQGGGTSAAQDDLQRARRQAQSAAGDLQSAGAAMAEDYRDKAGEAWDHAKSQARTWQQDAEDYVRQNPMKAVLTVLGVGFILGAISRR
ncbi:MAG: YqjD family protein [Chthoniobacterales bacterium]